MKSDSDFLPYFKVNRGERVSRVGIFISKILKISNYLSYPSLVHPPLTTNHYTITVFALAALAKSSSVTSK